MSGDVFHVPALGEQITNIAKISIIGNLRNSLLIYPHCFRNFLLRPSKAAQAKNNCVSACFLTGSNICHDRGSGLCLAHSQRRIYLQVRLLQPCVSLQLTASSVDHTANRTVCPHIESLGDLNQTVSA